MALWRAWHRRRLARAPFPEAWLAHLERLPLYQQLSPPLRGRLRDLTKVFAREKTFIGAGGLEITDEIRVVISACAARLVLHLHLGYYDRLTEIVVYPYVFHHPDSDEALLGEAHDWGVVVLSWPAVLDGVRNPADGHETATHEFAHVLDRADGVFDGTPRLRSHALYGPWARVLSRHYLRLRRGDREERRVLRDYGATSEAEFFAVATESYFEKPRQMKAHTPDLYRELQEFYGGDPAGEDA
jgi:Mlc titration factor MtfA (ptsG expression regulator)